MQSAIEVYTNTNYIGGGIERERESMHRIKCV